jgi:predicted MPP superfamily phosphohydrolase
LGIHNIFLRKIPDLLFVLAGVLSQLYIARKLALPKLFSRIVIATYLTACLILNLEIIKDPPRPFNNYLEYISSCLTFFGWMTAISAIVLYVRLRIPSGFSKGRRQFLNSTLNTAAVAICAAPAVALTTGFMIRKDFQIKEFELKIPGLPKDLNGLRLLQLSDIHIGSYFSKWDLRRVVDLSNGLRADLAFITGDMITGVRDPLDDCLLELKRLKSTSGLWGCLGNHEKYANISNYATRQAQKQGIFFLRHQSETLKFGDGRMNLVGVDHQVKNEGYLVGLESLVKPEEFNVLLSHNPDVFPVAARQGFHLTLAGHTHGGQINLEVAHTNLNIADVVTPYTKGLYQQPGSSLYVTSGLGTIGVPVRLGAPPEITLIRLCAS